MIFEVEEFQVITELGMRVHIQGEKVNTIEAEMAKEHYLQQK